jgi:glyoxylase-like metal-dependent hydrolase (beta-lactamase superfamily II)
VLTEAAAAESCKLIMKEIFPGLYQMPLTLSGFDPGSVNAYIIKTASGLTAIDTGWDLPEAYQSLRDQLADIGALPEDISEVILTHCHIDHLGMVPRFKKLRPVKVYLHARDLDLMRIRYTGIDNFLPMTDSFLRTHGFPASELVPPEFQLPMPPELSSIVPDVLLRGGEELTAGDYQLLVINTPGHTPGHVVFYEPHHQFLISGDLLLPTIATNAAFHVQHLHYPLQQYLESLDRLYKLPCRAVLPGHEHVFNDPQRRIAELVSNHFRKADSIYSVLSPRQSMTAYQISLIMAHSARTGISRWPDLNGWEKRFAVLQTIAHLRSLEYNHKVYHSTVDGLHFYQSAGN